MVVRKRGVAAQSCLHRVQHGRQGRRPAIREEGPRSRSPAPRSRTTDDSQAPMTSGLVRLESAGKSLGCVGRAAPPSSTIGPARTKRPDRFTGDLDMDLDAAAAPRAPVSQSMRRRDDGRGRASSGRPMTDSDGSLRTMWHQRGSTSELEPIALIDRDISALRSVQGGHLPVPARGADDRREAVEDSVVGTTRSSSRRG